MLGWDQEVMNLPGQKNYNPQRPWCCKMKRLDSNRWRIDNAFTTYVDDVRTTGGSRRDVRETGHVVLSRTQWLGQQDAPRKRRALHRGTSVWAGSITLVESENIYVTVDEDKWARGKNIVAYLQQSAKGEVDGPPPMYLTSNSWKRGKVF